MSENAENQSGQVACWDVIIVGGGAAGLMAAASAAQSEKRVLLLEKNTKLGVKILMSGGTRCNITHHCDARGIVKAFGKKQGSFLHSALAALSPEKVVELVESQGVETKVESTGKVFPVSNRAIDVRDAMVRLASESGAEIRNPCAVEELQLIDSTNANADVGRPPSEARFKIISTDATFFARSVIVTTGGKSFPGCGTTGDGYRWVMELGHTLVDTVPALTPLLSNCQWANELKGITIDPTKIEILPPTSTGAQEPSKMQATSKKQKPLAEAQSSFLFTHFGFSGPSALDVSREVARHQEKNRLSLRCDFLPEKNFDLFVEWLNDKKRNHGKQFVSTFFTDLFPKRLIEALIVAAGVDPQQKGAELSKKQIQSLAQQFKRAIFPIQGTLGFEKAEVTAGGIDLNEVESKTMQSKLVEGLFLAGEILDLDGPIGGFNFQSAWSTGWLAGQHA
jgi:predicted Rossmann fold flavoprotein